VGGEAEPKPIALEELAPDLRARLRPVVDVIDDTLGVLMDVDAKITDAIMEHLRAGKGAPDTRILEFLGELLNMAEMNLIDCMSWLKRMMRLLDEVKAP